MSMSVRGNRPPGGCRARIYNLLTVLVLSHAIYDIIMFFAHESHEFTRITMPCLFKATYTVARIFTNSLIVFVRFVRPYRSKLNSLKKIRVNS